MKTSPSKCKKQTPLVTTSSPRATASNPVLPQRWEALWSGGFLAMLPCEHSVRAADDGPGDLLPSKGGVYMGYCKWRGWIVLCAMMALPALSMAQQATKK